jgi:hypothetical protein
MVLKNNKPSFISMAADVSETTISTQAGQETITLLLALVIAANLGAM